MYRSNSNYEGKKLNLGIEEGNVQSVYFFFIIHLIYPESFIGEIRRAILVPVNKVLSIVYVDLLARFQPTKNGRSKQFRPLLPFQLIPSS